MSTQMKVLDLNTVSTLKVFSGVRGPFTEKGLIEYAKQRPIIPMGQDADISKTEFFLSAAREHTYSIVEDMMNDLHKGLRSEAVEPYWAKAKLRARLIGYHFQVLMRNCHGSKFEDAERIMDKCGSFDMEREITRDKWLLPMSGSLYNDLRANFIASYAQQASTMECHRLLKDIDDVILKQFWDCMESNLKRWACLPEFPHGTSDAEHTRYINQFIDYERQESNRYDKEIGDGAVFALTGIASANTGWFSMFVDNLSYLCGNGKFRPVPCTGLIDTKICEPNKGFVGLKATEMFKDERADEIRQHLNASADLGPGELEPGDQAHFTTAAMMAQIFDRERLQLQQERARISKGKKTAIELERAKKAIVDLQAKCATLQSKLNAQPKAEKSAKQALSDKDRKIKQLEDYIKKLKGSGESALCEAQEAKEREETAMKAQAAMEDEISALQSQLAALPTDDSDGGEEEELNTSVFNDKRIVVIGGHPTWLRGMKGLHPNIEFYGGKETPVTNEVIQAADVIWLQTNCLGHPTFYRVVSCAKVYNKPIKFFAFAGHRACRQQIVTETSKT